ncbi:MAG: alpha/beta hydrolase-fold protein, partial [Myxococcota bacterium]|nr:alpha/beta hydrolase-fold protein [Myxococcota bacterium]
SEALADNLLGDPATRQVVVYLPEGYDDSGADYPLMVDLVGFTGSGFSHVGWKAFAESVPQRAERLMAEGQMGPTIFAFPDCFTSLGGNQYINSLAMGRWADFLIQEMIPAIESRFRVRPGRAHRAAFGKSSGGFGAIYHGMRYGEHWGAVACHSGDMGFDRVYAIDFPKVVATLEKRGGIDGFLDHLDTQKKLGGSDFHVLMSLAMAATYDPDPEGPRGIRLPVDLRTCVLDPERWACWLQHDPVVMIEDPDCQSSLRGLKGLYVDCGDRDQYHIQFGSRQLVDRLSDLKIDHHWESFDDDHSGVDYRMDVSLPFLFRSISS